MLQDWDSHKNASINLHNGQYICYASSWPRAKGERIHKVCRQPRLNDYGSRHTNLPTTVGSRTIRAARICQS